MPESPAPIGDEVVAALSRGEYGHGSKQFDPPLVDCKGQPYGCTLGQVAANLLALRRAARKALLEDRLFPKWRDERGPVYECPECEAMGHAPLKHDDGCDVGALASLLPAEQEGPGR